MLIGLQVTPCKNIISHISKKVNHFSLLNGFRELSEDDQEELIGLLEMKLRKTHKARGTSAKSSGLTDTEKGNMVG